jgi:hypothetical protein
MTNRLSYVFTVLSGRQMSRLFEALQALLADTDIVDILMLVSNCRSAQCTLKVSKPQIIG